MGEATKRKVVNVVEADRRREPRRDLFARDERRRRPSDRRRKADLPADHALAFGGGRLRVEADDDQAVVGPRPESALAERDPGYRKDGRAQFWAVVIGENNDSRPSSDSRA